MDTYRHNVSASFARRAAAERVLSKLLKRGLSREQLQILDASERMPLSLAARLKSRSVRNAMLTYGAIGAVVGGVLGALAQAALVISDVGLLTTSPLLAPIMLMGWGAFLGAFLGALAGLTAAVPWRPSLTPGESAAGGSVLLANTLSAEQTSIARDVLTASCGACKDVDMVQSGRDGWLR